MKRLFVTTLFIFVLLLCSCSKNQDITKKISDWTKNMSNAKFQILIDNDQWAEKVLENESEYEAVKLYLTTGGYTKRPKTVLNKPVAKLEFDGHHFLFQDNLVSIDDVIYDTGEIDNARHIIEIYYNTNCMPQDFAISFSFGHNKSRFNILDTYNGKMQKDLISSGKAEIDFKIPEDDLEDIFHKLYKCKIFEIKEEMTTANLMANSDHGIWINPATYYQIIFRMDNVEYTVTGDYTATYYQQKNEQAKNFSSFIKYMTKYLESTEEYQSLPEAKGGYQ